MQNDLQLRAAARVIYNNVHPSDDECSAAFDEAESFKTEPYRHAIGAAQEARSVLAQLNHSRFLPLPQPALTGGLFRGRLGKRVSI